MKKWKKLLFPPRCPGCDRILELWEEKEGFCPACRKEIRQVKDRCCMKCGKLLEVGGGIGLDSGKEYCNDCANNRHAFARGRGVYVYRGPMKGSMYRFKYGNRRCYARTYAADAERALGGWIRRRDPQMIVPVPLYFGKRRKRGYNQAEVWAKALGERLGVSVEKRALLRLRATRPQKELNPAGRIYNLDRAFYARRDLVEGKRILLADDIYTTGSTMDAASGELLAAGAVEVCCISICTGAEKSSLG